MVVERGGGWEVCVCVCVLGAGGWGVDIASRKHAYIILTPLNPIFI